MDKVLNSKQRWAARHVQIKITVSPEIADKFKAKCLEEGISMTSKLKNFMGGTHDAKMPTGPYTTRQKRRKAIELLIREGDAIAKAEQAYLDRMPENLESSPMHDAAENAIEAINEGLDKFREAFQG